MIANVLGARSRRSSVCHGFRLGPPRHPRCPDGAAAPAGSTAGDEGPSSLAGLGAVGPEPDPAPLPAEGLECYGKVCVGPTQDLENTGTLAPLCLRGVRVAPAWRRLLGMLRLALESWALRALAC